MKLSLKKLFKKDKEALVLDLNKYKKKHNIERDWMALLVFFALLLVGVSLAGYEVYEEFVVRDDIDSERADGETIDKELLQNVIQRINKKEEVFESYTGSTTTSLIDPSL